MLEDTIACDQQPEQIAYAIRLTLLAKSILACHLPTYCHLHHSSDLYQVVVKKPTFQLSEMLEDEEFLVLHGHMVIKGLLNMLLELRQVNATLHNLDPRGLFVSSQGSKLMLVDLLAITFKGMPVLDMNKGSMPYSNYDLPEHS